MNILQISAPKSGSYWLHTILVQILNKKEVEIKNFLKEQPVFEDAKELSLSFKGQEEVDMLDIEDEGCFYRVSSVLRKPVNNLEEYAGSSVLTWTHSTYCSSSSEVFQLYDKKICIVRDPRDRALSSAKFAFTPYMQEFYPSSYSSPNDYLNEEYERLLDQWVWFVGNYLYRKDQLTLHFLFYERLLHDFENEFEALLNYLEISLTAEEKEQIAGAVSFSQMKTESPGHLRKGKYGKWAEQLTVSQKELAIERAGYLMSVLNYPAQQVPDELNLPALPGMINREKLQEVLEQINWHELYP